MTAEPTAIPVQPDHGSIILTQGETGTAWQRHHSDGLWHSTTGLTRTWAGILKGTRRPPILVWDAAPYNER